MLNFIFKNPFLHQIQLAATREIPLNVSNFLVSLC